MRDEVASKFSAKAARTVLTAAILCGSAVLLSGCKMFVKTDPPPCPRVSILGDASELTRFKGAGRDITDVSLRAKLVGYEGACQWRKDQAKMAVDLKVSFDVMRGAAGDARQNVTYFVALPAYFPFDGAKKLLTLPVEFPKNGGVTHVVDKDVVLEFPISDIKQLEKYEIFVGLQLDDNELQYNRQHGTHGG